MRRLTMLVVVAGGLLSPAPGGAVTLSIGAEPVATGLAFPAGFTLDPAGRVFYGERFTGEIRIYDPANGTDRLFFRVRRVETGEEQGLLGIALHPRYPTRPFVFAYATRDVGGDPRNQILRIRDAGGMGTQSRAIWTEDVVANARHNAGRILFGPDRMLYAAVGDATNGDNAQDLSTDAGKILRMTDGGTPPPGNPFGDSLVWSYGLRNTFGFTFDPLTGELWETENGPSCNDELNRISRGANYAWGPISKANQCDEPPPPPENTNQDGPDRILPLAWFTPVTAPTGTAFCVGCGLLGSEGTMFFGEFNTGDIRRAELTNDRMGIDSITTAYSHPEPVLSVERGPDGGVYFSDLSGIWKLVND
jgi:glucose/arabinose dehydrogenase